MPKRKISVDINTAESSAGEEIDRHFSQWLNSVEKYIRRLFVPDNVILNDSLNRVKIQEARELAALMGTEVTVLYFAQALNAPILPEQADRAAEIAKAKMATRRQVAELIGRSEIPGWGNDPTDQYGKRGASFDPSGVMIALGPYWSRILFIGEQLSTMGIIPKPMRHADVGGAKRDTLPLSECV